MYASDRKKNNKTYMCLALAYVVYIPHHTKFHRNITQKFFLFYIGQT